ncbi:MAG: hypothetical protein BZY82_01795 [SAR202 cluster bacterium Io17-Chloro-G3]|nr:MAG: hypothetical protein BZY82_01795 [SAR202 cluster bacterium Io17-Chloro-G3]
MKTDILEGLNPAQREAAETTEGPLLIIAGPGSGKTRVITHRIAYLARVCGVNPHRICAVTFTNKAARELRERLYRLLGSGSRNLTCSTFHALCASILRQDGKHIGLERDFAIYDDEDQRNLLKRSMEEANIDPKRYPPRAVQNAISRAKSTLLDPAGFASTVGSYYEEIVLRIYERYQALLFKNRAVDFDDLILTTTQLFQRTPEVLHRYQARYIHLLIDEFQDTNIAQYSLAKLLAGEHRNICVVGDPDQSIYSWRNADIRNILSFQRDYPEAKTVALVENYRSTRTILDAAKQLISPNRKRLEKDLYTNKEQGAPVVIREAHNEEEEAQMVIQEVDRLGKEDGFRLADCAVMYRINAQSRALEEACLRYGTAYKIVGAVRFYHRREVKDLITYLRVINNPYDEVSLTRVLNTPPRGIGTRTVDSLSQWAKSSELPLYTALQAVVSQREDDDSKSFLQTRALTALSNFLTLINGFMEEAPMLRIAELIDSIIEKTGYRQYLATSNEQSEERWENILEFRGQAVMFQEADQKNELWAFLERVALVSDTDNLEETQNSLTLITLHQAKGLEFPVVFIVGMEEGLLPHMRSLDTREELEEERRLCYVGVTRAEQRLYLMRAFRRTLMGGSMASMPSRFLADIPPGLIEPTIPTPISQWNPQRSPGRKERSVTITPFNAGEKVRHGQFGDGIVVNCLPTNSDYEITVAFKGESGVKRLLLSFAGLEKIEDKDTAPPLVPLDKSQLKDER